MTGVVIWSLSHPGPFAVCQKGTIPVNAALVKKGWMPCEHPSTEGVLVTATFGWMRSLKDTDCGRGPFGGTSNQENGRDNVSRAKLFVTPVTWYVPKSPFLEHFSFYCAMYPELRKPFWHSRGVTASMALPIAL